MQWRDGQNHTQTHKQRTRKSSKCRKDVHNQDQSEENQDTMEVNTHEVAVLLDGKCHEGAPR